ncbi:MAG TPA: aminopeptidase [Gaiellaceae bacterium]|nr:aminopeptidase [Gaiellaceae bacterium]
MDRAELTRQLADLAVGLGANVQPGQIVTVGADHGQYELARAIAESAYKRGAKFVDVQYFDPYVKRARIAHAADETLPFVPSWFSYRMLAIGEERAARISLAGPTTTGLLDDLDHQRAGRDQLPFIKEILTVISKRTTNWTVVPCPTQPWACLVYPDVPPDEALDRLWEQVAHVCRLDEPDPVAAWNERAAHLTAAAGRLNDRHFDALHFEGPGTDLTIGLLSTSTFHAARDETVDGVVHLANLPTEEVYATPDPQRADGYVRSTKPLVLADGTIIRGLDVRFEGGRAVDIDAAQGAGVMRGRAAFDEGASRLGEVALVDREGRIGRLGTVFYDTLLDENAASHIALGDGSDEGLSEEDRGRRNHSSIHIDFMIGGEDVEVTGVAKDGSRTPVLSGGSWQI